MVTTQERLHELIGQFPDRLLNQVEEALRQVVESADPLLAAFLNAPIDDEPLTPKDIAAIEEGEEDSRRGDVFTLDEVCEFLGIDRRPDPATDWQSTAGR